MTPVIEKICIGLLGVLVGAFIGHRFAWGRDCANRIRRGKDEFLAATADIRARFDAAPSALDGFFRESKPLLEQAVYRVRPFVSASQWSSLARTLREYQAQQTRYLDWSGETLAQSFITGKQPKQVIQEFLDSFDKCVTD